MDHLKTAWGICNGPYALLIRQENGKYALKRGALFHNQKHVLEKYLQRKWMWFYYLLEKVIFTSQQSYGQE